MQNLTQKPFKLILPKNYLSYSAITTWLSSKDRFRREYYENGDKLDTKYLRFGKGAAKAREDRELNSGEFTEYEVSVIIKGVPIYSRLDLYDSNTNTFIEDKTGKHPWTQSKVQKHEQLPFYATVLRAQIGKMPESCVLNWFETKDFEESGLHNEVEFTGVEKSFTRDFDERECDRIEELIVKCAEEISEDYQNYIKEKIC